jgi:hypothetical protein
MLYMFVPPFFVPLQRQPLQLTSPCDLPCTTAYSVAQRQSCQDPARAGHDDIGAGDQCSGALREASPHDRGAVCTGPDEDELCPAPQPHHGERGGQLLGVRLVVERTRGDDGRRTGHAHQRTGGHGV